MGDRESIIVAVKTLVDGVSSISKVVRNQPNSLEDLSNYAATELPLVAVVGGIPQPVAHPGGRRGKDFFLSTLQIQLFCYFMDNENPDTTLSTLLSDLWIAVYASQRLSGQATGMELKPDFRKLTMPPYCAFALECHVQYKHTTGGI